MAEIYLDSPVRTSVIKTQDSVWMLLFHFKEVIAEHPIPLRK